MITAEQMLVAIENAVIWERGSEHAWTCDAIIGADMLRDLVKLAAKAPLHYKKKHFITPPEIA